MGSTKNLILDGHKLLWHKDRVEALLAGEKVAPITVDCALTRKCTYKCLPPKEEIMMADGSLKLISKVEIGDWVSSIDSNGRLSSSCVLMALKTSPNESIMKIEIENGKVLRCTPDHLILTKRGWLEAKGLREGDAIAEVVLERRKTQDIKGRISSYICKINGTSIRNKFSDYFTESKRIGDLPSAYIYRKRASKLFAAHEGRADIREDKATSNESSTEANYEAEDVGKQSYEQSRDKRESASLDERESRSYGIHQRENAQDKPDERPRSTKEDVADFKGASWQEIIRCFKREASAREDTVWTAENNDKTKQNRSEITENAQTIGVSLCWKWEFMDRSSLSEWQPSQPRFCLGFREKSISDSLQWKILASCRENGGTTQGLSGRGLASISHNRRFIERYAENSRSDRRVVRWANVTSIQTNGKSPTYDIEVFPYHNFVASGFIVHNCIFCYSKLQCNDEKRITQDVIYRFLDDAAEIGVKAVSFVSDGESTCSPYIYDAILRGKSNGLDMALGTNGYLLKDDRLEDILPALTYIRFNVSAAEPKRYSDIMGCPEKCYEKVMNTIRKCVRIKRKNKLAVTIGLQMVLMPKFADQIILMAMLGKSLGVDYTVIKHCSDDEFHTLGIDYIKYYYLIPLLEQAEEMSNPNYLVKAKWSKILSGGKREYSRCYAPPLIAQFSGSGLVSPCGMLFNRRYKKQFHIGNLAETSFKKLWQSDRYWEVMNELASDRFDARTSCGSLCLQHLSNIFLNDIKQGKVLLSEPQGKLPEHINFI